MYSKFMESFSRLKQPKLVNIIRICGMLCAVMILLNELQQVGSSSWYYACLYCFFLIPSLYFTSSVQHKFFLQMREVITPLKTYTSIMAVIYLGLYIHQLISYDRPIFPAFPHWLA